MEQQFTGSEQRKFRASLTFQTQTQPAKVIHGVVYKPRLLPFSSGRLWQPVGSQFGKLQTKESQ